jgi:hypothetical protein
MPTAFDILGVLSFAQGVITLIAAGMLAVRAAMDQAVQLVRKYPFRWITAHSTILDRTPTTGVEALRHNSVFFSYWPLKAWTGTPSRLPAYKT